MKPDADPKDEFCRLLDAFHSANECDDAEGMNLLAMDLLAVAANQQARNPCETVRLRNEASEHANAGRWEQAEAVCRRVLALAEFEGHPAMIFKAHSDLSSLFVIRGIPEQAVLEADKAVEAARNSNVATLLSVALGELVLCHLKCGEIAWAAAAAEEAVQSAPVDKLHDVQRARAILLRARCRVERGQIAEAQEDLEVTRQLLAPRTGATAFSSVQSGLANYWEITARIKAQSNDPAGAVKAMEKGVEFRRRVSQLPHLDGPQKHYRLAVALQEYSVMLFSVGEKDLSRSALEECRGIQAKMGIAL